jgi:hypothetical protein
MLRWIQAGGTGLNPDGRLVFVPNFKIPLAIKIAALSLSKFAIVEQTQ